MTIHALIDVVLGVKLERPARGRRTLGEVESVPFTATPSTSTTNPAPGKRGCERGR